MGNVRVQREKDALSQSLQRLRLRPSTFDRIESNVGSRTPRRCVVELLLALCFPIFRLHLAKSCGPDIEEMLHFLQRLTRDGGAHSQCHGDL